MNAELNKLRFCGDQHLEEELLQRFGLEAILSHWEQSGQSRSVRDMVLSTQLKITPILSPRLCGILASVQKDLAYPRAVELFVEADPSINAYAYREPDPSLPDMICVTSSLIEKMNDEELRFVFGHELGHLLFNHPRLLLADVAVGQNEAGESRIPPLPARRLECWMRLSELSADRIGFLASRKRLGVAVSAFFKLTSGLGPEHLRFDISAFLDQLEELEHLTRREVLSLFSHPATPIRVRALQIFRDEGGPEMPDAARRAVDAEVARIARLMEFEVTEELDVHARDFLMAAGLLLAGTGERRNPQEHYDALVQILIPYSGDPEALLSSLESADQAQQVLHKSASWLRENAGEERFVLFRQLASLAMLGGQLDAEKETLMQSLGQQVGIPARSAVDILYQGLASQIGTRTNDNLPGFAFREEQNHR